jgi:peptidyl-prolyl cis-trans isomerase SurA
LYYVFNVREVLQPKQREYSEAKGLVTAAYQNQLEKEWLLELRKKYNVVINTENLHSIAK